MIPLLRYRYGGQARFFFALFLFLRSVSVYSQDKSSEVYTYARQVVDTLASPSMHGRGYVNDGDKIAANYIEGQFKALGLKKIGDTYRQEFHLSVNTFSVSNESSEMLEYGDVAFVNGRDLLIKPNSPPRISAGYKPIWLDSEALSSPRHLTKFQGSNFKNKILVLDPWGVKEDEKLKIIQAFRSNPVHAQGVIYFNKDRLMWDVARDTADFPSFEILVNDSTHKKYKAEFKKSKRIIYDVRTKFIPSYSTQNLIAYIQGTQYPDSFIVFTAHYDHLGQMDRGTYFPGANDNASGSAMLLNLARYYSQPGHAPKYSIAFLAFGAEEAGLVGSRYYTEHPLFPLKQIKFLINMDIMGTGDEGITVVNGTEFKPVFDALQKLNDQGHYLPEVKIRGKAANSDHYPFFLKGVPDFFIYTRGGIKAYHDIYDRAQTLPLTKFEDVFHLITAFESVLESGNKSN